MTLLKVLKERLLNKKALIIFAFSLAFLYAGRVLYPHSPYGFYFTQDVSLDQRLWFFKPYDNSEIKEGDYILFKIFFNYKNKWNPKEDRFLKKVVCVPSQKLEVIDLKVYCDGKELGTIQEKDSQGDPVSHFVYNGKIPQGKYFVMGTHPFSYDSRYFGFVDRKYIEKRAYPIF